MNVLKIIKTLMNPIVYIVKLCVLALLRVYQLCISPVLPPHCAHTPTCSHYMVQAVNQHGVWRGVWLGIKRLLRCHPFSKGGYDPVP